MFLYHAFKYFLSPPHPDKVPTTMTHSLPLPSKQLPPILKQWSFDDSIPHTICQLKELPIDPNTLKDLQATNVTKITKPPLPVDTRLARIERFKCDNGRPGKLESSPLIQDIIRASKSQWKLDNIYISNELDKNIDKENSPGVVRPGYELLRSFSPPPGSLNILQFLAIVNAVSSTASHYSALHYMCLWFATSVYLATKQYISFSGKEHTSSHLAQAGTAKGLPLVNPHTGDLTFVLKSKLNDLYNNFLAQGVSHDVLVDLMDIIAKDEVLFKEEGNVQLLAVSSIVTAAQVQYDLLEEFFEKKCRAAQYHLDKEKHRQEADRKRLEAAEAGQVTERKKAQDERKRAEYERKKAEAERERAEAAEAGQAAERKKAEAERRRAEAALEEVAALRRLLEGQKKQ